MAEQDHLDNKTLERLRGFLSQDKLLMLLDRYVSDSERLIDQLGQSCEQGDREVARRCAHSLKSTSANIGAMIVAGQARIMEELARDGEIAAVQARLPALRGAFQHARTAIGDLTQSPGQPAARR